MVWIPQKPTSLICVQGKYVYDFEWVYYVWVFLAGVPVPLLTSAVPTDDWALLQFLVFPIRVSRLLVTSCRQWPGGMQGNGRRGRMPSKEHHCRSITSFSNHPALKWHSSPISPSPNNYWEQSHSLLVGSHSSFQPVYTDIPVTNTGMGDLQMQLQFLDHLRCFQQAPFIISTTIVLCYRKPTNHEITGSATWRPHSPSLLFFPLWLSFILSFDEP